MVDGEGAELIIEGESRDFTPRFRESAYTPIKKLVGEKTPKNFDVMKAAVDEAATKAISKKKRVVEMLGSKNTEMNC